MIVDALERDDRIRDRGAKGAPLFALGPNERWYVAMTAPRQERLAAANLANQNMRSFLPLHAVTRRHARKFRIEISGTRDLLERALHIPIATAARGRQHAVRQRKLIV